MEKRVSDFKDDVWEKAKREDNKEFKHVCNCKKKNNKVDRLDDIRLILSLGIKFLSFLVLVNLLVITGRML